MEALVPFLVLACPIGMGLMMLWMHRSSKGSSSDRPEPPEPPR